MHQVWHCMAGMVFTPLLQLACTKKWETLETTASYYLRERKILPCWILDPETQSSESVTDAAQQRLQLWQVLL